MKSNLTKINFVFPRILRDTTDKDKFCALVMKKMRQSGSIEYAGYLKDEDLYTDLLARFESFDRKSYVIPTREEKRLMTRKISSSIRKCFKTLPHPNKPIFIFVFPWFTDVKESKPFGGVNAVAVHESVMHIFLAPKTYTKKSLAETIVHEYNHLVFYHYQGLKKYSLLEHMIMEGLAETFREEVIDGKPAPWATALTSKESRKTLLSLSPHLQSKNRRIHRDVLFGSSKYKRWTGYSIGYQLVKKFRKKNPTLPWCEIIVINAKKIA